MTQANRSVIQILTLLYTNCVRFMWVKLLKPVLPKVWSQTSNINITREHGRNAKSTIIPHIYQNLWDWIPEICALARTPRDSDACSSLKTTNLSSLISLSLIIEITPFL